MYSVIAQSPGRINIIGEHTDYNEGLVLPAAIDRITTFKLRRNNTEHQVNVKSIDFDASYHFNLKDFHPIESGWENYVMGLVHELQKLGAQIKGFDGEFSGDVPIGSGMSSSAALECSLAIGLNALFNLSLEKWQLIKASQMAEHNFVGMKCGIMDQFASILGKESHVMLLDCRSLSYDYYPLDLQDYELLLLNTNVSHSLTDSEYNKRRQECLDGLSIIQSNQIQIQSLRDVSEEILSFNKKDLPEPIFNRCKHVVSENQRVMDAVQCLLNKNLRQLGKLMYQSHYSLKNDYEVSCPELDFLVDLTIHNDSILGSRMMGGGFGGCTLNLIEKSKKKEFLEKASMKFTTQFGHHFTPYSVTIANGGRLVKPDLKVI